MIPSPCYDSATKTDCPKRKAGCQCDCSEWAEYTRERNAIYDDREKSLRRADITYGLYTKKNNNKMKYKQRLSRRRNK